ncbi:MAG: hypothetical protein ACI4RS_00635 [Monoglobaceae bacterium]
MDMTHPDILKMERDGTLKPENDFDYDEYYAVREDEYYADLLDKCLDEEEYR